MDLNCDMGELKADQIKNFDAEIMPFISSCNIACGFHSGSPPIIQQTIQAALAHNVNIGAHPSYNDRPNFGRVSVQIDLEVLMAELCYQIGAVKGMVESLGGQLQHVKAHGALYNDMVKDWKLADCFVQLIQAIDPNLKIMALAHSIVVQSCKAHGMKWISEGFADRRYENRTQLRSRQFEDAVIHDPKLVLEQVGGFLKGEVKLINGTFAPIEVNSICLHSDTEGAVALSKMIYAYVNNQK